MLFFSQSLYRMRIPHDKFHAFTRVKSYLNYQDGVMAIKISGIYSEVQ